MSSSGQGQLLENGEQGMVRTYFFPLYTQHSRHVFPKADCATTYAIKTRLRFNGLGIVKVETRQEVQRESNVTSSSPCDDNIATLLPGKHRQHVA